jgi:Tellurite resistance protein TerB
MLEKLPPNELMRLMKFVCSFAWSDHEVKPQERDFVARLIKKLKITPENAQRVEGWLKVPPPIEEIDPTEIPKQHRQLFIDAIRALIGSDGEVSLEEREDLELFTQLIED